MDLWWLRWIFLTHIHSQLMPMEAHFDQNYLSLWMWFSGVFASGRPWAYWAQWMRLQAVFLCQDESRCGEDRHDPEAALPAHRRPAGIRGGGPVPRFRGETKPLETISAQRKESLHSEMEKSRCIVPMYQFQYLVMLQFNLHPSFPCRRWRCPLLPSCSCESPAWSCVFGAGRRRLRPIWKPRPSCGTWWSKRCGPVAPWRTNTR